MAVNWNTSFKKFIHWTGNMKAMFFYCYYISFPDMQSFFEFIILMGYIYFETVFNDFISK